MIFRQKYTDKVEITLVKPKENGFLSMSKKNISEQ